MCISFDAGRICLGPRRRFHFRMNFSVRKGCNICRIVRVSHYSEMLTITTLPLLLLASGWFWSPRPRTYVKSGNSLVFPSADIRRHVTACKVAVFLRRGHPQTQRHVISKHFALVRRHPQTSAQRGSKVRRHPQTTNFHSFARFAMLLFSFFYAIRRLRLASHRSQALRRHHWNSRLRSGFLEKCQHSSRLGSRVRRHFLQSFLHSQCLLFSDLLVGAQRPNSS